jgi:beta-lactamase domain protein
MKVITLGSGSKGNCALVLSENSAILIDAGITYRLVEKNLENINLSFNNIDGILITHCHKDHTAHLKAIIKNTKINAYIPKKMYESIRDLIPIERCIFINDDFNINDFKIKLIHTSHDAPSSVGYIIESNNKKMMYVTDTGYLNRKYVLPCTNLDIYLIESNHDETMLMNGPYPHFLKARVIGDEGHLSNSQTAKFLKKVVGNKTKIIMLLHLSEKNNNQELAYNTVTKELNTQQIKVIIAKQDEESPLLEV